jgi:hypothetical protein
VTVERPFNGPFLTKNMRSLNICAVSTRRNPLNDFAFCFALLSSIVWWREAGSPHFVAAAIAVASQCFTAAAALFGGARGTGSERTNSNLWA